MPYSFTPPTVQQGYAGPMPVQGAGLFRRMKIAVGQSLLKNGGFYTQVTEPDSDQLVAADRYYIGGYLYIVSDDEAADLADAGYAALLAPSDQEPPILPPVIDDESAYGAGSYGSGIYGS